MEGALAEHSCLLDEYIVGNYNRKAVEGWRESVCLVALGGYGREELFPFSDIDIMILYRPEISGQVEKVTDSVLYPLWDTGLEVGHGVRTVAESISHAEEDYFFLVALLDARLLCGSTVLFDELMSQYRATYVDGYRDRFVAKMKEYWQSRRERFGSHSYLLEPHVKEGRGGLRDIQAMMWTARVVFGLRRLEDLCDAGIMVEAEMADFLKARLFLFELRSHLHLISKRKTDQLYFEQQEDLAASFGYRNKAAVKQVEHFMRDVYQSLKTIRIATDLFFDHVDEVLGLAVGDKKVADKVIERGVEVKRGSISVTLSERELQAKPQILLRVFLAMARTGLPMHHRSRKFIPLVVSLITDKERMSPRFAKTFFATLIEAKDLLTVLGTMLETGMLGACIPEFKRITGLAQYDLYHIYTVDRHSLQAVVELHRLLGEWPVVAAQVKDEKILYLAALMHDIGKGTGRDHSEEGADVVMEIGHRLSFDEAACEEVSFLIRYHLFIPENSLRRDLNDAVFIKKCSEMIGTLPRLAMLYLLSVADSIATGPSAWSDWKAALMEELYLKVSPYLDLARGIVHDVTAHEEQGVQWLREQIDSHLLGHDGLRVDPATLGTDYILSFSPEEIAQHVLAQRDNYQRIRQKTLVAAREDEGGCSVLIMTVDRPGLLAKICGVMALNNLSVSKAQIFTWEDGTVVDVIDVKPTDGLNFAERNWQDLNDQLDKAVAHRMGLSHRLYSKLSSTYGRKSQMVGDVASKVVVDNKSSENYSVIEVYAPDLPGQLYYITQAMADFGINIHKAYIATEVEQLIDAFYVLDSRGNKLVDDDFCREITQGMLHSMIVSK